MSTIRTEEIERSGIEPRDEDPVCASAESARSRTRYITKHGSPLQGNQKPPGWRNGTIELFVKIDTLPVRVRFFVNDVPAERRSEFASGEADIRSLLANTLEKMVHRMRASPLQLDDSSRPTLAIVEAISSRDRLITQPAPLKKRLLRVDRWRSISSIEPRGVANARLTCDRGNFGYSSI